MPDLQAARDFMRTHARVLDQRRFDRLFGDGPPEAVLAALEGYANSDGGYGWGLEPDLRAPTSQIGPALHAFEAIADAGITTPASVRLADWLQGVTLDDGGLPFALAGGGGAGSAPFWAEADPTASSLQLTAAVVGKALLVAGQDPAVAAHPWLAQATDFVLRTIESRGEEVQSLELRYALEVLDGLAATRPEAAGLVEQAMRAIPENGIRPVEGGAEGESMRPLDWSPLPDRPTRDHLDPSAVEEHLDQLAAGQLDDGGWVVDFGNFSPAAELEWRGYRTVFVLSTLQANGRALA